VRSAATLALVLAACDPPIPPETPSWQVDVMPLFGANCVRCHAYPFRGDGTTALRLDSFDDTPLPEGNIATGASKSVQSIFRHTFGIALLPDQRRMPPDRDLTDYELDVIRNWIALGDGTAGVRGPGHPDNHEPTITITEVGRTGTVVTFAYQVDDRDNDMVVAAIYGPYFFVKQARLEMKAVVGSATGGTGQFTWDTFGVPAGTYTLRARLDDGYDVDPEGPNDYIEADLLDVTLP